MINKVMIIAEAGVNHNGDLNLAKRLVEVAAEAGADFVKFQTFSAERITTRGAGKAGYQLQATAAKESQYEMLQRLELSLLAHEELVAHCDACGIGFLSTGFDLESIDLLIGLGQKQFKLPSGEITNLPYLRYVGRQGKPVILSTGMCTLGEVEAAIDVLESEGLERSMLTVLHCTTEYPTPMAEVNLRAMQSMHLALNVAVGYSDHTSGIEVAIAAVAMGASVIEKHFTLNRALPGPDHQASLEPMELSAMVRAIRNIEMAMGDGVKRLTKSEEKNRPIARKSLVATCLISAGEVFNDQNIAVKRPGSGISPMRWDEVIGRAATRNYAKDDFIEL
jgi:N,N'-diacetyllegionaminate synthase